MWIFGYGSLIWRPSFPFVDRQAAWIEGWTRRFYQASTDHRGVPEAPGRVVTLLEAPGERCWGMAYQLPVDQLDEILDHLDYREKGGYTRHTVKLHFAATESHGLPDEALIYIATTCNHDAGELVISPARLIEQLG